MEIGKFEVKSGTILATDPCYEKGCGPIIDSVKNGTWKASIRTVDEGPWGNRVAELRIHHEDNVFEEPTELINGHVGVDSGQAGFFDYESYPEYPGDYGDDSWYDRACDLTFDRTERTSRYAGIMESMGVNSSSGFGDGVYDLYVGKTEDGQVVSAKIVFIDEEEEDFDWE